MPYRWDKAAEIRRSQIESGADLTFSKVFVPYYQNLISSSKPASLLEIGCGTGNLSAILSSSVPVVVALEPSRGMYETAREVLQGKSVRLLNCSVEDYRKDIRFDILISHMCIQTVDDLGKFIGGVVRHMGFASLFVFAIPHPCFYNSYKLLFEPGEYHYMQEAKKAISFAITKDPGRLITGVPYNHRPLSRYFALLKDHSLHVVDFHEMFPGPHIQELYGRAWEYPWYCVFFARKTRNQVAEEGEQSAPGDARQHA